MQSNNEIALRDALPSSLGWRLAAGSRNNLCDVAGVRVGHCSLREPGVCTGVTAVLPNDQDLYRFPLPAGVSVLNGFGKSAGLIQLQELGELETPILLTNTFSVPECLTALTHDAIVSNPEIGRRLGTVNPVVMECNDGQVNDIQRMAVRQVHAREALASASADFEQGTVGVGSGMRTFGFAGGIGSASRMVPLDDGNVFTLGVLVLSNFGQAGELRVAGERLTNSRTEPVTVTPSPERGSIIVIMATDAPMDARQLTRLSRRSGAALGRLGSHYGHGSGDISLAFSTANACERGSQSVFTIQRLCESCMDGFFIAATEATEEAVLQAIWCAEPQSDRDGRRLPSFRADWAALAASR